MGAATSKRRGESAAGVLDFAVAQILGDDTAVGALPAVLARMVEAFGLRAALAFQPSGGQPAADTDPAVLAVHPPGAVDRGLLARIGVVTAQRERAEGPLAVTLDGQPGSVLLARSVPVRGHPHRGPGGGAPAGHRRALGPARHRPGHTGHDRPGTARRAAAGGARATGRGGERTPWTGPRPGCSATRTVTWRSRCE